ncbi:MAG TPA: hypothetical protein PKE30_06670 [Niabella sp.]|nr:hypothetical protein [Niabella sp.]
MKSQKLYPIAGDIMMLVNTRSVINDSMNNTRARHGMTAILNGAFLKKRSTEELLSSIAFR